MAKGSGLSIDSDPIGFFLHRPIVLNSFQDDNNNYIHHKKIKKLLHSDSMDATIQRSPPHPTLQFPVNLNCTTTHDDDHKRTVMDEMDFFADHKTHDRPSKANSSSDAAAEAADTKDLNSGHREREFKVNVSLLHFEIFSLFN